MLSAHKYVVIFDLKHFSSLIMIKICPVYVLISYQRNSKGAPETPFTENQTVLWPKKNLSNLTFMLINFFNRWSLGGLCNTYKDGPISNYLHCLFVFFRWPAGLETSINAQEPLNISGEGTSVYLSSSPPQFCPQGREIDIDAIRDHSQITKKIIRGVCFCQTLTQIWYQGLIKLQGRKWLSKSGDK